MARLGIYGGSFNPPHVGHRKAAEDAIALLGLDKLLVIPAGIPPHKALAPGSPTPAQRLALTRLTFADVDKVEVLDREIHAQGPCYTSDTLAWLAEQYPEDERIVLVGTDMLLSFRAWHAPERILSLAAMAVLRRQTDDPVLWAKAKEEGRRLAEEFSANIQFLDNQPIELSSTEVRRWLALGCAADSLVPAAAEMIARQGLYALPQERLSFARLKQTVLPLHKPERGAHVVGCSDTALALAQRWGADPEQARRAGILHDVTKALNKREQLILCEEYGIILTDFTRKNDKLLHAKTGAAVARRCFGECEAVCQAILWHTTGRANMTLLEKIVYLADYIEPNRSMEGVERLRALAKQNLDQAVCLGLKMSLDHLRRKGREIDPDSQAAWEFLAKEGSCV